ncbi:beta strand repeat-containing protein [Ralstonia pseudosolanacearum]|uniref:beta strand repeat-containing protein n=1 Tax=Ralstonia pseudosolanacearum TaxID=1310165 RepID=UPI002012CA10|nr:calcium-binding protein [Ralstonia pseudosolanacearum]MCL1621046.1 calcium-binding protein [Ralstonia pseudosolanacearum CaRs-Mep]
MAQAYLDALESIAERNYQLTNKYEVDRDISAKEVWNFHEKVFEKNGLGIENWTLDSVFKTIQQTQGDDALEAYWESLRDTQGEGPMATLLNIRTMYNMHESIDSADPAISKLARNWMELVPGIYSSEQFMRSIKVLLRLPDVKSTLNAIDDLVNQLFRSVQFDSGRDPLVVDLGKGIRATGVDDSKVLFDLANAGQKEAVGWIASGGFLVNTADGPVTSGAQLFGDAHALPDGSLAANGFQALAPLDSNADGHINASDTAFGKLAIWTDTNQDGIEQADEVFLLSKLGIQDIDLTSETSTFQNIGGGNVVTGKAKITWADGHQTDIVEANLVTNGFYTVFTDNVTLTPEQAALPFVRGSGQVRDTRQAAARSPDFSAMLQQYAAANTRAEQLALLPALIDAWAATSSFKSLMQRNTYANDSVNYEYAFAGVAHYQSTTLGYDALIAKSNWTAEYSKWTHLVDILEKFNGQTLFSVDSGWMWGHNRAFVSAVNTDGSTSAYNGASPQAGALLQATVLQISLSDQQMARLQQSYDALLDSVYGGLVLQTRLDKYVRILQSDHPADVLAALQAAYDRNPVNGASDAIDLLKYGRAALDKAGVPLAPTLQSMAQDLDSRGLLSTWLADNPGIHYTAPGQAAAIGKTGELNGLFILTGPTQKADPVQASAGQGSQGNVFFALHGNTTVDASKGDNQQFFGGDGPSRFIGGTGANRFQGGAGDMWMDGHLGSAGTFTGGKGNDTMIGGTGLNIFSGGGGDDAITSNADAVSLIDGGIGNDTIRVSGGGMASIDGGAGDDIIRIDPYGASQGADIMGGTGDDQISLGYYSTTLRFNRGDGHDTVSSIANAGNKTIVFGPGISAADLSATRVGNDMILNVGANGDAITITNWFLLDGSKRIDTAVFADGTRWNADNFRRLITTVTGTAGDDTINGWQGDDTINGWQGDDILIGGDGNDTLVANGGNDQLYGGAGNDSLRINDNATASVDGGDGNDIISADSGTTSTISAGNGDDTVQIGAWAMRTTIDAGNGNDIINIDSYGASQGADITGGTGDDQIRLGYYGATPHFNRGDGHDTVSSAANAGNKTIVFGPGISAADLSATRLGNDIVLNIGTNGDAITVTNWFQGDAYRIDHATFADGTQWDQNNFRHLTTTVTGTASDDTINGWQGDDVLVGGDGNDTLISNGGNDQLYGGGGNDSLRVNDNASASVDGGDGNDTISADSGTTSTISAGNGDDTVQFGAWAMRTTIDAGNGNDIINIDSYGASQGADITGGTGDDQIRLGYYGATLHFNRGDGHDTVSSAANAGNKTVVFGPGISAADLSATRVGDDMVLNIGTNGDAITVTNWFQLDGSKRIDTAVFADGTRWNADNFRRLVTTVTGTAGDDTINGWQGDDILIGGDGNDTLVANGGNDQLYGGAGNDSLRINDNATASVDGGDGNDTISADSGTTSTISAGNGDDTVQIGAWAMRTTVDGGAGNDIINIDPYGASQGADITGGTGDDQIRLGYYGATLHFNRGDGHDTVSSAANAGNKTIVFGPGISAADLSATRVGNDMVLNVGSNGDAITVTNWFQLDGSKRIDTAVFADGTRWNADNFRRLLTTVTGTAGDDTINGWQGDDILIGGDGNDTLISNGGSDQLYGGAGTDSLRVNNNATASVDGGDGNDTISADSGTTSTISAGNGDDTVQIGAWAMRTTVDGGAGNDIINIDPYGASQGADITGGTGDDQIRLGYYGATLHFNRGDGHDTVSSAANAGNKTIVFGPGISAADLSATRLGNDMVLNVGSNGDAITVTNWFQLDGSKRIDTAVFSDGTRWNADNFRRLVTTVTGAAGDDTINGWQGDDILIGGDGNDTLISNGGSDQLYGGAGTDTLRVNNNATASVDGGDGNDTISADSGTTSTISAGNGDDIVQIGAWSFRSTIDGGAGNDIIKIDTYGASQGADITGGTGDDQISLGYYGATLRFNRGDGHDTVSSAANADNKTIVFGSGITAANLSATRVGDDMVLNIGANGDAITITNWFQSGQYRLRNLMFADGTTIDATGLVATYNVNASSGTTKIQALTGFDDKPLADVINFKTANSRQLWFERQDDDLLVSVIGSHDVADFTDWYSMSTHQNLQLRAADGLSLTGQQVDALVQAMAQFSAPPAGQTTLTPELQDKLAPVIAANWH